MPAVAFLFLYQKKMVLNMNEKLYAPQIDNFIDWLGDRNRGGFNDNCTFTEMSYKLIDKFFDLLERISPVSESGCRELWFCVERGTIEDFGDYEDMYKTGEVESYEEFEQLWKDFYPKEQKWYYVEAVHDEEIDYKAVMLNHKLVIAVDPRAEKGFEYDIDIFANWLYEETEKCIKQMKNGTYMNFIRANLPLEHRTGTITQKNLWDIYPDSKKEFFEGLSDKDIDDFIAAVTKQEENPEKITDRLHSITANDFYGYCSIGYSAMGYDIGSITPKEQYFQFADGRDGGLSEINENSSEEFVKWLNGSEWHGSHPWEVCRGGNSTHISLYVYCDNYGFYLGLAGSSYSRSTETIKFYLALFRSGIPVVIYDGKKLTERVMGTEKIGVVPQGITPKYCHSYFPGEDIISFINLPYENTERVAQKCVWQDIREIKLISNEV